MINGNKSQGATLTLANFAVSGSIGTAPNTVDKFSIIECAQTTASIAVTFPNPTVINTTAANVVLWVNNGSQILTVNNRKVGALSAMWFEFDGTNWIGAGDGAGNVYTQVGNPNIFPIVGQQAGDICVQTSDGTTTGVIQATWAYNGTTWVHLHNQTTVPTISTGNIRTYFPVSTALQQKWTTVRTVGDVTSYGFTGVGTSTIAPDVSVGGHFMLLMNGTVAAVAANLFTIPTNYVRHEVLISPGVSNQYFIATLRDRESVLEVWICDPTTGVPVSRLMAQAVSHIGAGFGQNTQIGPDNGTGCFSDNFEWLGFEINSTLIATYKTAGNTIKLALRPGSLNQQNALFYIGGFAMCQSDYGLVSMAHLNFNDWVNEPSQIAANQRPDSGNHERRRYGNVGANQVLTFKIPVVDATQDVVLAIIGNAQSGQGTNELQYCSATIIHGSGNVVLNTPQPAQRSPAFDYIVSYGHNAYGWKLTAAQLAAKSNTPANSAIPYLTFQVTRGAQNAAGSGFVMERL